MDENSAQQLSHQNGSERLGGVGGGSNSSNQLGNNTAGLNSKQGDENQATSSTVQQYSIPGILHYIQHEFSRFEIERSQWDVDRAELQVTHPQTFFKRIIFI